MQSNTAKAGPQPFTLNGARKWLREHSYLYFVLGKRVLVILAFVFVTLVLPVYGFIGEAPDAENVWLSGIGFLGSLNAAAANSPTLAVGAAIAVVIIIYSYLKRRVSAAKSTSVIGMFNEYNCLYQTKYESDIVKRLREASATIPQNTYELVVDVANELLAKLCTRVAASFEVVTGNKCAATIKIIRDGVISTRARDLHQFGDRTRVDGILPEFKYEDNTAFKKIVEGQEFYCSNWLPLRRILGQYINTNPEWARTYLATAVIPVYLEEEPVPGKSTIIAFLCVDNFSGRFPKNLSRAILESYCPAARRLLRVVGRLRKVGP